MTRYKDVNDVAKKVFGYKAAQPWQRKAVDGLLDGRDVFVIRPTGGGKSFCFQAPAKLVKGPIIVFSPLISLMRDQLVKMTSMGFKVVVPSEHDFTSGSLRRAMSEAELVYVAPERVKSRGFRQAVALAKPAAFAVDEAHELPRSQRDWRVSYKHMADFIRKEFPAIPRMALTATISDAGQAEVCKALGMKKPLVLKGSQARPNLIYSVEQEMSEAYIVSTVKEWIGNGKAIVFCGTRARAAYFAYIAKTSGIRAAAYHAGMDDASRRKTQDEFKSGHVRLICGTSAFGMGVDVADVRVVVHADVPPSLADYVQQAGRAGRDGKESQCILNVSAKAFRSLNFMASMSNPQFSCYECVWDGLREAHEKAKSGLAKISTRDLTTLLYREKAPGVTPFTANGIVNSVLGYLEYVDAISIQLVSETWPVIIKNRNEFMQMLRLYKGVSYVQREKKAYVTVRANHASPLYEMEQRKVIDYSDDPGSRNPNSRWEFRLRRLEHGLLQEDVQQKRDVALEQIDEMRRYVAVADHAEFILSAFGDES